MKMKDGIGIDALLWNFIIKGICLTIKPYNG